MNIYLISQTENNGYDTYDSAVVIAPDEATARNMDPQGEGQIDWADTQFSWASHPSAVKVELIGTALPDAQPTVVCASFNAG